MNPRSRDFIRLRRFALRCSLAASLALLGALVTGCPHNEYTVELKPRAGGVERTLTFYRSDGNDSNGTPKYLAFPTNELAAITRVYPAGAVQSDGQRHVATGQFAGALPKDVGGAGYCTSVATSLGRAGFYSERFRGNDDFAGQTERRFHAADQLTDLVIGWTRTEWGRERGYKKLRQFLDADFRRDFKNVLLYWWFGEISALSDTNAPDEFVARFGQYLVEHGYLTMMDAPEVNAFLSDGGGDAALMRLLRRLAAEKMEIPAAGPPPKSFAVLNDVGALKQSWARYLAGTSLYRAQVKEWERKRKTDAKLERPKPLAATDDLFADLVTGSGGEADRLTVKLSLPRAPTHSNGKWQDGQVIWEPGLERDRALPAFCYARWSEPDPAFQTAHFGGVLLDGDELMQYCLWQQALGAQPAGAWESFLAGLKPGPELKQKLEGFHFPAEPAEPTDPSQPEDWAKGRKLLTDALGKTTEAGTPSK